MLFNPKAKDADRQSFVSSKQHAIAELAKNRPIWTPDHVPIQLATGKIEESELDKFPLYVRFERGPQGDLLLPSDRNVLLSDELVYAAMKELTQAARGEFKAVWAKNGEIRAGRAP